MMNLSRYTLLRIGMHWTKVLTTFLEKKSTLRITYEFSDRDGILAIFRNIKEVKRQRIDYPRVPPPPQTYSLL